MTKRTLQAVPDASAPGRYRYELRVPCDFCRKNTATDLREYGNFCKRCVLAGLDSRWLDCEVCHHVVTKRRPGLHHFTCKDCKTAPVQAEELF